MNGWDCWCTALTGKPSHHAYRTGNLSLPASSTFSDDFHTFTLERNPTRLQWSVDGRVYHTALLRGSDVSVGRGETLSDLRNDPGARAFDKPFYLLLHLAIGGDWPGPVPADESFPKDMLVDYVRVYTKRP